MNKASGMLLFAWKRVLKMDEQNDKQEKEILEDWENILLSEAYSEADGEGNWFASLVGTEENSPGLVETAEEVPQESAEETKKIAPDHPVEEGLEELQLEEESSDTMLLENTRTSQAVTEDIFKIDYVVRPATIHRLRQSFTLHFSDKIVTLTSKSSRVGKRKKSKRRSFKKERRQLVKPRRVKENTAKLWPENQLVLQPITLTEFQSSLMEEKGERVKEEVFPIVPQRLLSFEKVVSKKVQEEQAPHKAKAVEEKQVIYKAKAVEEKQVTHKAKAVEEKQVTHKAKAIEEKQISRRPKAVQKKKKTCKVRSVEKGKAGLSLAEKRRGGNPKVIKARVKPLELEGFSLPKKESLSLERRTSVSTRRQGLSLASVERRAKSKNKSFTATLSMETPIHKNSSRLELTRRCSSRKEML